MDESPIWTLEEANAALPGLEVLTEFAVEEIESSARCWRGLPFRAWDSLRGIAVTDGVRADWARAVTLMGMLPKGYFVVAFQSPNPDVLWCWSYGEEAIMYQQQKWETAKDRKPIVQPEGRFEHGSAERDDVEHDGRGHDEAGDSPERDESETD